ncbi:MAG: HEPN domain-containing protein [Candidatus Bathyarchaeia archaeon]|nr:HEPN domain-containing protein [Candidatus Bathyarchaeota archaeon]
MSHHEVSLLRNRSLRMLNSAKNCLHGGDYDIAAFMAEQALQLYLKSPILELTGEVPRVHAARQLIRVLRDLSDKPEDIDDFVRRKRSLLIRLEEAYIGSRYLPRIYEGDEAEELVAFAEEAIRFAEENVKGKG